MGDTTMTFAERAARYDEFAREGRLVQGAWIAERDGREIACAIGAMYGVDSVEGCPADEMPMWLKRLVVVLFDGLPFTEAVPAIAAINRGVLRIGADAAAWARIERRFRVACVRRAIEAAEPVAKDAAVWPTVARAAQQVCDALEGRGDLAAAEAAAWAAARDAGDAAWAASWAAAEVGAYRTLHADLCDAMRDAGGEHAS